MNADIQQTIKQAEELDLKIADAQLGREVSDERTQLLQQLCAAEQELSEMRKELQQYADNDPAALDAKSIFYLKLLFLLFNLKTNAQMLPRVLLIDGLITSSHCKVTVQRTLTWTATHSALNSLFPQNWTRCEYSNYVHKLIFILSFIYQCQAYWLVLVLLRHKSKLHPQHRMI